MFEIIITIEFTILQTAIPNPRQRERRNASFMDSKNEVEKDPQE